MRVLQVLFVAVVLSCTSVLALRPQPPITVSVVEGVDVVRARVIVPWAAPESAAPAADVPAVTWRPRLCLPKWPKSYAADARAIASDEHGRAIAAALRAVDPDGLHPGWADELYRICRRESRCGQYGHVRKHAGDSWTGARSYLWAVVRGRLSPKTCDAHRLRNYAPVLRELRQWEREHGHEHAARSEIEALPLGTRRASDFATRGGWGMNAARGVEHLGTCVGPEALDEPKAAALVAAREFAACEVDGRACTCSEHTALWVGRGRWSSRPLVSRSRKSKWSTVAVQCGRAYAAAFVVAETARAPVRFGQRVLATFGLD